MMVCNVVAGVVLLVLVAAMTLGSVDLVMLYLVTIVLAACDVTYVLALQASVPLTLARAGFSPAATASADQMAVANGRLIAVDGAGQQFVGPAVGGYLFALARRLPFFGDGVSFFLAAVLVGSSLPRAPRRGLHSGRPGPLVADLRTPVPAVADPSVADLRTPAPALADPSVTDLRTPSPALSISDVNARELGPTVTGPPGPPGISVVDVRAPGPPDDLGPGPAGGHELAKAHGSHRSRWLPAFREGLVVFRRERSLKMLALMVSSVAFCQYMIIGVLVVYGTRTLHLSSTGYGFFLATASIVGVLGAFFAGSLQRRFGGGRLIVGGVALATISYLGLAFTRSAVLGVFVLGLQEFGIAVANVASMTARQNIVPHGLLGRVNSVHRLAIGTAAPVGALLGGFITSVSSAPVTMFVAGLCMIVALALVAPPLLRSLAAGGAPGTVRPGSARPSGA
jgi:MFS family permease